MATNKYFTSFWIFILLFFSKDVEFCEVCKCGHFTPFWVIFIFIQIIYFSAKSYILFFHQFLPTPLDLKIWTQLLRKNALATFGVLTSALLTLFEMRHLALHFLATTQQDTFNYYRHLPKKTFRRNYLWKNVDLGFFLEFSILYWYFKISNKYRYVSILF